MKKKFQKLSVWSFVLALAIFVFSYILYHYATPELTIGTVFHEEPAKPLVTQLWANLGVMFLFSSIFCRMIAKIFFSDKS